MESDDYCKPLNWKYKSLRILEWLVQTDNFKIRLRRGILEEHWLEAAAVQEDLFHFVTYNDVWGHLFTNIGKHLKPFDNLRWQTRRLETETWYLQSTRYDECRQFDTALQKVSCSRPINWQSWFVLWQSIVPLAGLILSSNCQGNESPLFPCRIILNYCMWRDPETLHTPINKATR